MCSRRRRAPRGGTPAANAMVPETPRSPLLSSGERLSVAGMSARTSGRGGACPTHTRLRWSRTKPAVRAGRIVPAVRTRHHMTSVNAYSRARVTLRRVRPLNDWFWMTGSIGVACGVCQGAGRELRHRGTEPDGRGRNGGTPRALAGPVAAPAQRLPFCSTYCQRPLRSRRNASSTAAFSSRSYRLTSSSGVLRTQRSGGTP